MVKRISNLDNWLRNWEPIKISESILMQYFKLVGDKGFKTGFDWLEEQFVDYLLYNPTYFAEAGITRIINFQIGDKVKVVTSNVLPMIYVSEGILGNMNVSKSILIRYAYDEIRPIPADKKELTIVAIEEEIALVEENKTSKVWLYNVANLDLIEGE